MADKQTTDRSFKAVYVLLHPCHELGLVVSRELCRRGAHVVVVERDPAVGELFCQRLAWTGRGAALRCIDPAVANSAQNFYQDLKLVYGQISGLITFFAPVAAQARLSWLTMEPALARRLIDAAFDRRLRLLRALTPLFPVGRGTLTNVLMGAADDSFGPLRAEAAVGAMLQQMLHAEWVERKLKILELKTALDAFPPGARPAAAPQVYAEARRILNTLSPRLLPTS